MYSNLKKSAIGIDFGMCSIKIAVCCDDGRIIPIPNAEGELETPAYIFVNENSECVIGSHARDKLILFPQQVIYAINRFLGRRYNTVLQDSRMVSYQLGADEYGFVTIIINGQRYKPEDLASVLLQKVKADAQEYLGQMITEAVFTVPATFDYLQRKALQRAANLAGIHILRMIKSSTAPLLFSPHGDDSNDYKVMVCNLGGGNFEFSIADVGEGIVEEISTVCDRHLGGMELIHDIENWMISQFEEQNGHELSLTNEVKTRLFQKAESIIGEMNLSHYTTISLPYLQVVNNRPESLECELDSNIFEEIIKKAVLGIGRLCYECLQQAECMPEEIGEVILCGKMQKIPFFVAILKKVLTKAAILHRSDFLSAAFGAAREAGVIYGYSKDCLHLETTSEDIGIKTIMGVDVVIPKNATIPIMKEYILSTSQDGQTEITFDVLQGNNEYPLANPKRGSYKIQNIPYFPKGYPIIRLHFDIDANSAFKIPDDVIELRSGNKLSLIEL